jgi:hypothetical protein
MKLSNKFKKVCAVAVVTALAANSAMADGVQGINVANTTIRQYIDPVSSMCLGIGAFIGIIGGIRVYTKWNSGDQDINKELMGWGGSCVFLVLVSVVIKGFFGV